MIFVQIRWDKVGRLSNDHNKNGFNRVFLIGMAYGGGQVRDILRPAIKKVTNCTPGVPA
jgi:hypothetical protein